MTYNGEATRIDMEALFWADCVRRPGPWRCAWQVMKVGLLIGLVHVLTAGFGLIRRLNQPSLDDRTLTLAVWLIFSIFVRAVLIPLLTPLAAVAVLLIPRLRNLIGDALAWSTDPKSHERVKNRITQSLGCRIDGPAVLVGHSQGGAILADVERELWRHNHRLRLVTLGSGHGLLTAVERVLPRWGTWRSILLWAALLPYCAFSLLLILSTTVTMLPGLVSVMGATLRVGAGVWLWQSLPSTLTRALLTHGTTGVISPTIDQLAHPYSGVALPTMSFALQGSLVAGLIIMLATAPARLLRHATDTGARGVDIVATHDLIAAAMLVLAPPDRVVSVDQCRSVILDHTSYFKNGCAVLPVLASQIEAAAGFHGDTVPSIDGIEAYYRSGLALRSWMRWLLFASITFFVGWFLGARVPAGVWITIVGLCSIVASVLVTASCAKWLRCSTAVASMNPAAFALLERARRVRASRWWALWLVCAAIPLVGGGAIVFTAHQVFDQASKNIGLCVLTAAAFVVGMALFALAYLSLFGAYRQGWMTLVLFAAALAWFLQGTRLGIEGGAVMLALAGWNAYCERRLRRRLAAESLDAQSLLQQHEGPASHRALIAPD